MKNLILVSLLLLFSTSSHAQYGTGGIYYDVSSGPLTSGSGAPFAITPYRAMQTNLRNSSGVELVGQKTKASSIPVTLASDQGPLECTISGGGGGGAGDASAENQTTEIARLTSIRDQLEASIAVTGTFWQATQPVSIASMPSTPVTGTFWQATQPVSGTFWQATQPVSGPLTDAQLRAVAVPVSGTFWQATQPVSGTVTANAGSGTLAVSGPLTDAQLRAVAVPVSGTFWQATQPISGTVTANAGTGTLAVSGTFWQATQPVSGTFWQATQPISAAALPLPSGASTVAKQPALGTAGTASTDVISVQGIASMTALKVDGSGVTQPVSGTFWQATQPVSGTFWQATQPVSGTFWQATQPVSIATLPSLAAGTNNIGDVDVLTLPALPAGSNNIGDVDVLTLPALTAGTNRIGSVRPVDSADADLTSLKGTQTSRALGVQDLRDAGRTHVSYRAVGAATGTTGTETLLTLTKASATSATSTGTSFVITSGKKYRISSITIGSRGNATATIQSTTHSVRVNTAGACLVSSTPIVWQQRTATPATASAWDRANYYISEGYEITGDGTLALCASVNSTYTTNAPTVDLLIDGYEY